MKIKIALAVLCCLTGLLGLSIYQQKKFNDGKMHVIFCDVGQGDGIYIRTPSGTDIVIDGGPDNSILLCLTNNMPFWDRKIELMILTHPDSDHYTGLLSVAKQYDVASFATSFTQKDVAGYQTLIDIFTAKKTEQRFVCQDDKFSFGDGISLKVLWPKSCSLGSTEKNDNSVVTLLNYKDLQILLTGDAEVNIGSFYQDLAGDIDILKVPHHGSKDGVNKSFLEEVKPEVSVLSVGAKNRYGHPAPAIESLLRNNGSKIVSTAKDGEVEIVSDGKTYTIKSGSAN